jgi:hypothetical protein
VNSSDTIPLILMVLLGAALVAWALRRLRPAMPPLRRMVFILGGGFVVGGALYGAILNR